MADALARLDFDEGVAVLTLNRPQRHNALIPELLQDLLDALRAAAAEPGCVLLLRAAGRSFSTGGDLLGFHRQLDRIADYAGALVGLLNQCILGLYTHPAPVVCAVQGQVTGGALGLVLAADRVIMHRDVTVTPWYTAVGFSPDGGWTALLPGLIGRHRAAHWLYSNDCLDARACLELGIAQQVTAGDVAHEATTWARTVAQGRSGSLRSARRLLNVDSAALAARLEAERAGFLDQIRTPEARAGIERFLNRELT